MFVFLGERWLWSCSSPDAEFHEQRQNSAKGFHLQTKMFTNKSIHELRYYGILIMFKKLKEIMSKELKYLAIMSPSVNKELEIMKRNYIETMELKNTQAEIKIH